MRVIKKLLTDGYEESLFDSSIILKSLYKDKQLYLYFDHMGVYQYNPVSEELYNEFVEADSQGDIFTKKIYNNSKIKYAKVFKMKAVEKDVLLEEIKKILSE